MLQMNVPEVQKIWIDFEDAGYPETVRRLQPLVWKEGDSYCCLLGPDRERGIFAEGGTVLDALIAWNEALHRRTRGAPANDEIAQYALDMMRASVYKVM